MSKKNEIERNKLNSLNAQCPLKKIFPFNIRGLKNYIINDFSLKRIDTKIVASVSHSTRAQYKNIKFYGSKRRR